MQIRDVALQKKGYWKLSLLPHFLPKSPVIFKTLSCYTNPNLTSDKEIQNEIQMDSDIIFAFGLTVYTVYAANNKNTSKLSDIFSAVIKWKGFWILQEKWRSQLTFGRRKVQVLIYLFEWIVLSTLNIFIVQYKLKV